MMRRMDQKSRARLRERFLSAATGVAAALCTLMFLGMIALTVFNAVLLYQTSLRSREESFPLDTLLTQKSEEYTVRMSSVSAILPEMIGCRLGDDRRGICAGYEVVRDYYALLNEYLSYGMSEAFRCTLLDAPEGEALWESCLSGERYVYVRYPDQLPYMLLYRSLDGVSTDTMAGGDTAEVREMFLLFTPYSEQLYTLRIVTRDDAGRVYSFVWADQSDDARRYFSLEAIAAYGKNSSFLPFSFARELYESEDIRALLSPMQPVFSQLLTTRCAVLRDTLRPQRTEASYRTVLELFRFNFNKLSSYADAADDQTYVENYGTLRWDTDGSLLFTAGEGGGIALSSYLSYRNLNNQYSLYDLLAGLEGLLSALRDSCPGLTGGDARLQLASVSMDGEDILVRYRYLCDNIPLYTEAGEPYIGCEARISRGRLEALRLNACSASLSEERVAAYPLSWTLERMNFASLPTGGVLSLGYRCADDAQEYTSQWFYRCREEEEAAA